jgi:hypothetical protein
MNSNLTNNTTVYSHVWKIASAKEKGMQNIAIKRSANARFTRKGRKSVLDLLPCLKTITTNTFPTTEIWQLASTDF